MKTSLNTAQAMRFNRQILMPDFDIDRQELLLNSHALMVGVGGLGCAAAQYLAAAGIGQLTLADDDNVEMTNLQRQILHRECDVGTAKVASAKQALHELNSECQVHTLLSRVDDNTDKTLLADIDIIVDCSDNLATRRFLNNLSLTYSLPLVCGAAIRSEGQLTSFIPGADSPCYACLCSLFGEQQLSCVESGILSPIVGIIGTMQALETIKILTDFGDNLVGKLLVFDGKRGDWQRFLLPKRPDCQTCGNKL
ncbi:HesA/MoeB/ThiF family protein [Aestuariibacter salexigens]|uniref:HesA/MoeB/ThiF family protein n=1 Tax=Aestuariibacter salexigens TaxID=226010 RepID=UPI00041FCADE|nr:molybdopterin-synthase adenylyltransferase MoeB [Aestuariibacter salexigens]